MSELERLSQKLLLRLTLQVVLRESHGDQYRRTRIELLGPLEERTGRGQWRPRWSVEYCCDSGVQERVLELLNAWPHIGLVREPLETVTEHDPF